MRKLRLALIFVVVVMLVLTAVSCKKKQSFTRWQMLVWMIWKPTRGPIPIHLAPPKRQRNKPAGCFKIPTSPSSVALAERLLRRPLT